MYFKVANITETVNLFSTNLCTGCTANKKLSLEEMLNIPKTTICFTL